MEVFQKIENIEPKDRWKSKLSRKKANKVQKNFEKKNIECQVLHHSPCQQMLDFIEGKNVMF